MSRSALYIHSLGTVSAAGIGLQELRQTLFSQRSSAMRFHNGLGVWGDSPVGVENAVAVHIRHLRSKIEIDPTDPRYLKVVWGKGYKMEERRNEKAAR